MGGSNAILGHGVPRLVSAMTLYQSLDLELVKVRKLAGSQIRTCA